MSENCFWGGNLGLLMHLGETLDKVLCPVPLRDGQHTLGTLVPPDTHVM